ncbi:MAG TPA: hypothetical protein VIL35_15155 [Vicinamibacterales bacterium]
MIAAPAFRTVVFLLVAFTTASHSASGHRQNPLPDPAPDIPFRQAVATHFRTSTQLAGARLLRLAVDGNDVAYVLTDRGVARVLDGMLVPDRSFRPLAGTVPRDVTVQEGTGHLYYLYEDRFLSNGGAGRPFASLPRGTYDRIAVADDGTVLLDGQQGSAIVRDGVLTRVTGEAAGTRRGVYAHGNRFYRLSPHAVERLDGNRWTTVYRGEAFTALTFCPDAIVLGTTEGYLLLDPDTGQPRGQRQTRVPVPRITSLAAAPDGSFWAGTPQGAFHREPAGVFRYYASRRWLQDDEVVGVATTSSGEAFVLTRTGLSRIEFPELTLAAKATLYERRIRERHIRYGLLAERRLPEPGDLTTSELVDTDNDGLWTAYYLASQAFRFAVTGEAAAHRHAWESFEALERLLSINGLDGFPSRSFERTGFKVADPEHWHVAPDPQWEWKGTTSSDEIVGHIFSAAVLHETAARTDDERGRIARFIDAIVGHIVRHDYYLVDADGQPTLWGRWHPDYVNWYPHSIGDRRLNSTQIIAALQLAHALTGNARYRDESRRLLYEHGYLRNITSSMKELRPTSGYLYQGRIDMGDAWNHSDDQLAFLTYWVLYRFAPPELRAQYAAAIRDHWEIERAERNPLWSFVYAATGAQEIDREEALWTLREWPLDLVRWDVKNSHRRDITPLPPNFRNQGIAELLPPGERPAMRWNGNPFVVDGGHGGRTELTGAEFLLPYWMGRYLGVIAPAITASSR